MQLVQVTDKIYVIFMGKNEIFFLIKCNFEKLYGTFDVIHDHVILTKEKYEIGVSYLT